jgi:Tfp pilus assembly protein PilE
MFLENQPVNVTIIAKNHSNRSANYDFIESVSLLPRAEFNPYDEHRPFISIGPNSENRTSYVTYLTVGQWELYVQAFAPNTQVQEGTASSVFVVEPVQDFYNLWIAVGTIAGLLATVAALSFQIHYSRQQNETMKDALRQERELRLEDLYKEHSKTIGQVIARVWSKGSRAYAQPHEYAGNGISYSTPAEEEVEYKDEPKQHLIKGYPDELKKYEVAKSLSVEICHRIADLASKYESTVNQVLQNRFTKFEARRSSGHYPREKEPLFYSADSIRSGIFQEADNRNKGNAPQSPGISTLQYDMLDEGKQIRVLVWTLNFPSLSGVAMGPKEQLENLVIAIRALIESKEVREYVAEINKLKNESELSEEILEADGAINDIKNSVLAGKPLNGKGSCRLCPR